jgi:site-specific DNA recombinase
MAKNNANSGKKKYVIYTRCSTDDQAQGEYTTLDAQAHHCQNMLDAFGYELADFGNKGTINDDGYSGKDLNRPGIQSILTSVNNKREFDGVIFFRLDRLTRNPRDLYALIDLFKARDVDFISVRENLDSSTAIGRVVIGILGLLSAFERELTGERVKASAIARVRQGRWVGGMLPYGYKQVDDGPQLPDGRQPRKIVIDEEVAQHLRVAWEMAAENRSLTEIGLELSKRGIKTPQGRQWRRQSLSNMIKNPFYKGYLQYLDEIHKGKHPAIVDKKLWERANKVLSAKLPGHHFRKKQGEYSYLLGGLLRCPKCGSYYISVSAAGNTKQKFFYYVCSRAKQGLGCDARAVSATAFDKALIEYFKKASEDREIIVKAIGDAILDAQVKLEEIEKTIKEHEEKLDAARVEARKLLDLAMEEGLSKGSTFKARMAELDEQILGLEDRVAKLQAKRSATQMSAHSGEFLHSNIRFAMKYLDEAPPDAQKSLIRALIKEIMVYEDRIELKMYVSEPADGTLACAMPVKQKRPTCEGEALTAQDNSLSGCKDWLPGPDSNQRHGG